MNKVKGTIKIKVDFGNGVIRHYQLLEDPNESKNRPHDWTIEFCHPEFGEIFTARREYREKKPRKKFNLVKYIKEKCELRHK